MRSVLMLEDVRFRGRRESEHAGLLLGAGGPGGVDLSRKSAEG